MATNLPMLLSCTIFHPFCSRGAGSTSCVGLRAFADAADAAAVRDLALGGVVPSDQLTVIFL